VRLITRDQQEALLLPEQAIVPQGDEQYVYKVVDGKALRTKIDIGQRREGLVEVLQGLDPDATIVTAGHLKIRDGSAVTVAGAARGNGVAAGTAAKGEPAPEKPVAPAPQSKS
jgi:membrane fusion protein (multidrug efflux system)